MFKIQPSAEVHLASKRFMETLSKSRLANVSKIAVGVDAIAFVDSEELRETVRCVKGNEVYLKSKRTKPSGLKVDDVYEAGTLVRIVNNDNCSYAKEPIPLELVRRDPEWIRKLIEENRPYDLPIFFNTEAFKGIVADLIDENWRLPAEELLNYTAGLLETALARILRAFARSNHWSSFESSCYSSPPSWLEP